MPDIIDFRQRRMARTYADAVAEQSGVKHLPLVRMGVPPIEPRTIAELTNNRPMLDALNVYGSSELLRSSERALKEAEALRKAGWKPTFGERLVDWGRAHGELAAGMVAGAALGMLLVCAVAYVIGGLL